MSGISIWICFVTLHLFMIDILSVDWLAVWTIIDCFSWFASCDLHLNI